MVREVVAPTDTPIATKSSGQGERPMRAHSADPAEGAALWPRLVDLFADFDSYQSWTNREIPVVVLESPKSPRQVAGPRDPFVSGVTIRQRGARLLDPVTAQDEVGSGHRLRWPLFLL